MNTAPSPCITIFLDDERLQLPAPSAISDLLTHLQRAPESVATALNGRFVAARRANKHACKTATRCCSSKPLWEVDAP